VETVKFLLILNPYSFVEVENMAQNICRYQLRPKNGTSYHLCPEKDVEAALELAEIKIPNHKSTVYAAGRNYTFFPSEEIPAEKEKILLDSLSYCGEFELVRILVSCPGISGA
jgi:hypothetical protein